MTPSGKPFSGKRAAYERPGGKALAVAAVAGMLVVAVAWWIGPSLFGVSRAAPDLRVVEATVTSPVPCTTPGAEETVRFEFGDRTRTGILTACGHDQDEQVKVAVPVNPGSGPIDVRSVTSSLGYSALLGPVGLLLLALSCTAGGVYAFLVVRGPRSKPALA